MRAGRPSALSLGRRRRLLDRRIGAMILLPIEQARGRYVAPYSTLHISQVYFLSLISSVSSEMVLCRGRKHRTSAKRYFGRRRRGTIRSGDFEFVFTSSYYYHSLILSFSLVILFCRGRKRRISSKRYFGWRRRDTIRPAAHHCGLVGQGDSVRGPIMFILLSFQFEFLTPFLLLFASVATLSF